MIKLTRVVLFFLGVLACGIVVAGEVRVVDASVTCSKTCEISVSLYHHDEGWEHYADRWEVLAPDKKTILATRVLYHPHVDEQPFTRTLGDVSLAKQLGSVWVRGHDNVHGYGREILVKINRF